MDTPQTLRDEIVAILAAAARPLTSAEIFAASDLAADERAVSNALFALARAGEIGKRENPEGGRQRFVYTATGAPPAIERTAAQLAATGKTVEPGRTPDPAPVLDRLVDGSKIVAPRLQRAPAAPATAAPPPAAFRVGVLSDGALVVDGIDSAWLADDHRRLTLDPAHARHLVDFLDRVLARVGAR